MKLSNYRKYFLLLITHILAIALGYYINHNISIGRYALSSLVNDMSTLLYIEKSKNELATEFLRRQIEVNIAIAVEAGTIPTGKGESYRDNVWLAQYMKIYNKYPKLDHPYDPRTRIIVDSIFKEKADIKRSK